jgi:hypothetical protein
MDAETLRPQRAIIQSLRSPRTRLTTNRPSFKRGARHCRSKSLGEMTVSATGTTEITGHACFGYNVNPQATPGSHAVTATVGASSGHGKNGSGARPRQLSALMEASPCRNECHRGEPCSALNMVELLERRQPDSVRNFTLAIT